MVIFGRPKQDRGFYKQWEENFEILSVVIASKKMVEKFKFYECYGIEEYYIFPDDNELIGWVRSRFFARYARDRKQD